MDGEVVYWVDGGSGDDGNDGSLGSEFATIEHAVDQIPALGSGTIKVSGFAGTYLEALTIAGKTVALVGSGSPVLQGGGTAGLTLNSGATVFASGFTVQTSTFEGIACNGPALWLDDSVVWNNGTDGVTVGNSCTAHLRNTMVSGHTGLGDPDNEVSNAGDLTISYSTIVGTGNGEPTLACSGGTTSVSNSVLLSETADAEACAGASFETSALNNSTNAGQGSTTNVGALMPAWFSGFASGNLRLAGDGSGTPFGGLAVFATGDLSTDIDGEARPAMGFVGADEP
jgi:hypothetical protein